MKWRLITALFATVVLSGFAQPTPASPPDYAQLKRDAEQLYADGSYAKAHELYARAMLMSNLTSNEARWVFFRNADTLWRSQAGTQTADTTKLDQARAWLEQSLNETQRVEDRDQTWAETQESLGDFHWTRRNQQNWGAAWPSYQQALDWWAGARDIERARERYLGMIWKAVSPPGVGRERYAGYWGAQLPLEVLDNALKIAPTGNDQARAHFFIAMNLRNQGGNWERRARMPEHFEGALALGKQTDWYDDALYHYAEWMANQGRAIPLADGNWRQEPDFPKALELFRRLVSEFIEGETRYWQQAQQQIRNITEPQLGVSVPHIFLPDSEIQYHLNWRNVKQIELALYPVEFNRDVDLTRLDERRRIDWLTSIDLSKRERLKSWTHDTKDAGDHKPGSAAVRLDEKLKPGSYVLEARAGGKEVRELILVTDAALVLKTSGRQALVYFCNALHSAPLANAKAKLWERWYDGSRWHAREQTKETGADGIAVFDLSNRPERGLELFASAILNDRQAFSPGNSYWHRGEQQSWRIYAFTDRPAYRPKETANWKFTARRYNGSVYSTPANATVEFEITDPRGTKVTADKVTLNAFGSAWGELELTEAMPLGEYQIQFWDDGRKNGIGGATLFRLEEYKLPEFKVSVQTPEEDGKRKAFRLGETVEVTVQADYYFGGPVANASVEVLVRQNPFWHSWRKPRDFPWFYEDMDSGPGRFGRWYGGGQIVKRETLKTDATGKATLTFETPANANQDFEYRIEARVTDASRREIVGNGSVRVTRQRYYVYPQAEHNLYRPQDRVRVDFKALDANGQPVQVEGTVKVTRDYWWEIWIKPDGTEVKGDELKSLQAKHKIWPPPPERPDQRDWRLKFRGYERDEILTQTLKTDAEGNALLTFTPEREGYYRIAWASDDRLSNLKSQIPNPIRAETTVWVARNATTDLGYRHGGVEIIADKDTFRAGSEAPVMLVANSPDRYVLFTVEGEELYHYRLVHLTGTVKLIDLFVDEKYVPNVFLSAAMVSDRQIFTDTKQVIVPPTKHFLTVDVQPDRAQYQPRDEGTLTITTKNDEGKPVSAEVALSLVDESVFYIQSDYAGDPRQFFYGTKRGQQIQTQATMNQKRYAKLVLGEKDELIEERERMARERRGREEAWRDDELRESDLYATKSAVAADRVSLGVPMRSMGGGGGAALTALSGMPAPAAAPMTPVGAVAEEAARQPGEPPGDDPAVQVRTDFRSTMLWRPDVKTDANGQATIKVKYPDSLTGWKATARAASAENQFGIASATTRTKQPLMVRLQAPRFFVVGDKVTISAVVNNNTDKELRVDCSLNVNGAKGLSVEGTETDKVGVYGSFINVPANGEARLDWRVAVRAAGNATLRVYASAGTLSDAMEKTYLAHEHGIEKFIAKSGKVRGNDITVKLDLSKERKAGSTSLTVQVTPSLAVTMLDALPYLIDYPYGCTEQTMSRFLPAAITAKTLRDVGLDPEDVMGRVFGGIESRTTGAPAAPRQGTQKNLAELDKMVKAGLERLYDFQHSDGGWGWWKEGESDHWMTAYVLWGMLLARDARITVKEDVLSRARDFLAKEIVEEEENPDMQAFMLHALVVYHAPFQDRMPGASIPKALDNLWSRRDALNAYTRALLALSAHHLNDAAKARVLIENLENGVKRDERPDTSVLIGGQNIQHSTLNTQHSTMGTAHWGEDGIYRRWSDGGVEATAFALRALLTIDPKNKLIEPVTNWLIKNRRGAQWSNTRDTAIVVLAMNDYLRVSGELKPELEYELFVNGKSVAKKKVAGEDVFNAPSRFVIAPNLVSDANEVRLVRHSGDAPIYFSVEAKFFSLEEPITAVGNEIFVKREYYKLVGRPTLLKGYVYDKEPLRDGESVKSGERVETLITIEAKNNYEYLVFEDLKPAGFEAVEVRSGESLYARELKSGAVERKFGSSAASDPPDLSGMSPAAARRAVALPRPPNVREQTDYTGRQRWVYQELRDRKVALFVDKLPEGVWQIRYDLRAEVPGEFHALPVLGHAMYVPEIRANSAELRVKVAESTP
ncbi:MAG: alpha-2-macroglobulin [Verrucomicrobiae bacterium]|nr:alpha-2-macroglobulin [Verrucomicrobiae bacterium]